MGQSHVELSNVHSDAVQAQRSPSDATNNRLQADVHTYMSEHNSPQDRTALINLLRTDLSKDQLSKLGIPDLQLDGASHDQSVPAGKGRTEAAGSARTSDAPAVQPATGSPRSTESQQPPSTTVDGVVERVHRTEDNFHWAGQTNEGMEGRQTDLRGALTDADQFSRTHTHAEAQKLADTLRDKNLIPQLAIESLYLAVQSKQARGEQVGNLTADQAASMIDQSTPLGKEMAEQIRKYFGPHSPDVTQGTGFADGTTTENGKTVDTLSPHHLEELALYRFEQGKDYKTIPQEKEAEQHTSALGKMFSNLLDETSHLFSR